MVKTTKPTSEKIDELELALKYACAIVNTVREPLVVLYPGFYIKTANKSFYKTFKMTKKETVGKIIFDIGNEQWDIPKLRHLLEKILPKKDTFDNFEVTHTFEDIGKKTMLLNARQLNLGKNKKQLILLAIEDVTKLKETEKKRLEDIKIIHTNEIIKNQNDQLQSVFDQSSTALAVLRGKNYCIEVANTQACVFWDKTKKQVIKKPFLEILPELKKQGFKKILDTVRKTGELYVGNEHLVKMKFNGKLRTWYFDFSFEPMRSSDGNFDTIIITATDATKRVESGHKIEESEKRFHTLFDLGPVAVYSCDATGMILDFNRIAAELWGHSPKRSDVTKRFNGAHRLYYPDDTFMPNNKSPMALVLNGLIPEARDFEVQIERKDKTRITTLFNIRPLKDKNGKITGAINCFIDITERKQIERQKEEFISIASHELKTPVSSIKGYTQFLQNRFKKDGNKEAAELLERMDGQINKLTSLIADLLDSALTNGGKLKFKEGTFDFNELINEIISEMQLTTIKHLLIPKLAPTKKIYGDRDRVGQVITNFISNAIKYSPNSDKIIVTTDLQKENVTLAYSARGNA